MDNCMKAEEIKTLTGIPREHKVSDAMKKASEFATLRLPVELHKQVDKLAKQERRTRSLMMRILIEEALEQRISAPRAAMREVSTSAGLH
jgi:predicted transcriptional regulator